MPLPHATPNEECDAAQLDPDDLLDPKKVSIEEVDRQLRALRVDPEALVQRTSNAVIQRLLAEAIVAVLDNRDFMGMSLAYRKGEIGANEYIAEDQKIRAKMRTYPKAELAMRVEILTAYLKERATPAILALLLRCDVEDVKAVVTPETSQT